MNLTNEVYLEEYNSCFILSETKKHYDHRGFFQEINRKEEYTVDFLQDSISYSKQHVLRGLHFQDQQSQLTTLIYGNITYFIFCKNKMHENYGTLFSMQLKFEERNQVFAPANHAHGFYVSSLSAIIGYKNDVYYNSSLQSGYNLERMLEKRGLLSSEFVISERDKSLSIYNHIVRHVSV